MLIILIMHIVKINPDYSNLEKLLMVFHDYSGRICLT